MAINDTFRTYVGDGVTDTFAIPFVYDFTTEVVITRRNGSVNYTFINPQLVRLSSPLMVGDYLTVQRVTNIDSAAVTWKNGSGTTGTQLNAMARQLLSAMQEARDMAARGLFRLPTGEYDVANVPLKNVPDPTDPGDAINKRWAETAMTSTLAQARQERVLAQEAREIAEARAAQTTADTAQTYLDRLDVTNKHDTVVSKAAVVDTKHAEVVSKAAQVALDATAVAGMNVPYLTTVKDAAESSRDAAYNWANGPINTEISPGNYSAKHWAALAQAIAAKDASAISFAPSGYLSATNVQAALVELDTEKAPVGHTHDDRYYQKSVLDTALAGKSDTGHTHAISDVTNLQATLNGKAAASHTHAISDVSNLQATLNAKSDVGHNHGAYYVYAGFSSSAVYIGWNGSGVHCNVDSTYIGQFVFTNTFQSYFAQRRVYGGEAAITISGAVTQYDAPGGSFMSGIRINTAGAAWCRAHYLQWLWNGTWYGVSG